MATKEQKSSGFDKDTDICGFLADICGHTPTSSKIYTNVCGSPHMSAAYARPVVDIAGTGKGNLHIQNSFNIPLIAMAGGGGGWGGGGV